jgi:hypothetical protein
MTQLYRDLAFLKEKWDVETASDLDNALPAGMTRDSVYTDEDAVHQFRKLAEKCNPELAMHILKFARIECLKKNYKCPAEHELRVKYIIAPDVRFVRQILADPKSMPIYVAGMDDEVSEDESEGESAAETEGEADADEDMSAASDGECTIVVPRFL